jgi:hypothetical protein
VEHDRPALVPTVEPLDPAVELRAFSDALFEAVEDQPGCFGAVAGVDQFVFAPQE